MVQQRPMSERTLMKISGVGDSKMERFGDAFLDVIRNYEYGG
jgi:ATP-dependent DNA helicase RecQ